MTVDTLASLRSTVLPFAKLSGVEVPLTMRATSVADWQAAQTTLSGAFVNDHAPVFVVQMTGHFTSFLKPPGADAPTGDVMTVTVNAQTMQVTDIGYHKTAEAPDMANMGSAVSF